jgi:hypothetical protein
MKPLILLAVLLAAMTVGAQTANVIELTPADQARAQKAYGAYVKAETEWNRLEAEIGKRYIDSQRLVVSEHTTIPPAGFENGFEFSRDFRFIVPRPPHETGATDTCTPIKGCVPDSLLRELSSNIYAVEVSDRGAIVMSANGYINGTSTFFIKKNQRCIIYADPTKPLDFRADCYEVKSPKPRKDNDER